MTENLRERPGDQPLPAEGQENVQDALIAHIRQRKALGVQRYGRPLQTFNGRDAVRDLLEELLDGATYAMQVQLEIAARQDRVDRALAEHQADLLGNCYACRVPAPCSTRRILTGQQPVRPVSVTRTHPVEEIACSTDAVDYVCERFQITEAQTGVPNVGEYMGMPVYVDDALPPRTVRMQPRSTKQ
ncbi:hypothetical protein [Streptomyces griseoaurantiacus]|uniref:hypothetical protein n=1 Tax=Streptomyces griseoaurantiacus TaxID=68213 RepID=UPI00369420E9